MSKQLFNNELAEIVTGLLIQPSLLVRSITPETHQRFMLEIAQVVADNFGGHVNWINEPDNKEDYFSDTDTKACISISPNEHLPALNNNIWSFHDVDGWEDYLPKDDDKVAPLNEKEVLARRQQLQGLLSNSASENELQAFNFSIVDHRLSSNASSDALDHPDDDRQYNVKCEIGSQSSMLLSDQKGAPCFSFMFEIDYGVPALRIASNGRECDLHVLNTPDGLALIPSSTDSTFEQANSNRFTCNNPKSILLRTMRE